MQLAIRFFRRFCVAGAAAVLSFSANAGTVEVGGIKLDDTIKLANMELKLNGAGIRYKAIFKVYAAGLYLSEKKSSVPDVLAVPGPKRVTIVMLRDVGNEELGRGFMTGIQQNSDKNEKARLIMQLQKFGEIFGNRSPRHDGEERIMNHAVSYAGTSEGAVPCPQCA